MKPPMPRTISLEVDVNGTEAIAIVYEVFARASAALAVEGFEPALNTCNWQEIECEADGGEQ